MKTTFRSEKIIEPYEEILHLLLVVLETKCPERFFNPLVRFNGELAKQVKIRGVWGRGHAMQQGRQFFKNIRHKYNHYCTNILQKYNAQPLHKYIQQLYCVTTAQIFCTNILHKYTSDILHNMKQKYEIFLKTCPCTLWSPSGRISAELANSISRRLSFLLVGVIRIIRWDKGNRF